ncbi:NAD(P)-dependent oxidoreductase [Microbispora sp. ATCC PTA-5024]|uniref:NAD(P)-dependent oxidoreductase n=1 Tax=Microbispora sp. ATCC PTA-5024 TaxID=316330 RepID=UPI0003DCA559|nr:NAD(P)H-binding protein [Microbispora sp. ATCC PTA-5024]ETK34299.1 NAD-binding protein [Microbispora sp. ATCC PTA-5024]
MGDVIVFGAGGRAGRAAVREALRRGRRVTAVVRDPARHPGLGAYGPTAPEAGSGAAFKGGAVRVVAGDVTDAGRIAELAAGHDAAIGTAADLAAPPGEFFPAAARALLDGLGRAGVRRLVVVGLASVLETASGTLLMDTPGYPGEYRAFFLGHAAGDEALRSADTPIDWVVLSPAGDFDHDGDRTGRYRAAPADADSRISYADFAIALLDEIDEPRHHRVHLGVETG